MRAARVGGLAAPRLPLVVGGSGQLGRHMLQALADAGCARARVLDARPPPQPPAGIEVEFVRHRLGQDKPAGLAGALQGVDSVFSMLTADVQHATKDEMMRTNARGVQELVDACCSSEPARLVHISSTAVTDLFRPSVNQSEEEPLPPRGEYRSGYETSKRLGEEAVLGADGEHLATVALRPHSIVSGCNDVGFRHMWQMPGTIAAPEGAALQDYIPAEDLCQAAILAEERLDSPSVRGQAFFVTKGEETTSHDMSRLVAEQLGWSFTALPPVAMTCIGFGMGLRHSAMSMLRQPVPSIAPQDFLTIPFTQLTFDNSRAMHTLGYEPKVTLSATVERIVAEYRAQSAHKT